jgi:aerobic-type carbon monoxide dehydrogenase small subunit (CoxS/CutS family)
MPDSDLFDEPGPGANDSPGGSGGGGSGGLVTRRQFVVGAASAAAAGAAVGVIGSVVVSNLSGGGESGTPATTTASTTGTQTTATSGGGEVTMAYPGYLGGVPASTPIKEAVIALNVNGQTYRIGVTPDMSLLEALRTRLGLVGTKLGCNRSECSACSVLVDGVAQNSCSLLAIREEGKQITTIEGLQKDGKLNPVQEGFLQNMGLQCGFCTPGQIVQTTGLLLQNAKPTEAEIRRELSGNLCKCSAYHNILASVQYASDHWDNWSL